MSGPSATRIYHKTTYPSIDPKRPELSVQGKTIVITGGGTGIGAEIASSFAKAGAKRIALLGRREQPLLETKARIEAENPATEVLALPTDITKKTEVISAFERATSEAHSVDVLISNAAILGAKGLIKDVDEDQLLQGITMNLLSNFNLSKVFLTHASKDATLVEINSAVAHVNVGLQLTTYSVSKAATARFYSALAYEHPDLNVYCIQPGVVDTDLARDSGYKPKREGEEMVFKEEDVGKLSMFDDARLPADFCVWLASPEARFLKGKYLWANWDVEELKANAEKIKASSLMELGLIGWPFDG